MLGDRIRKRRKAENLTVAALAEKVGVSESYISQLERGLADPSVSLLRKLAFALNVPVSSFFDDEGDEPIVTRFEEREKIISKSGVVSFSWISPAVDGLKMEIAELEVAAGAKVKVPGNARCICLYLMEGCFAVHYQDMDAKLSVGDSIFIPANTEFELVNDDTIAGRGIVCVAKGGNS